MSAFNFFSTKHKALNLRTVDLTTADGEITYTAKTGRAADNFITDAVIRVTTTSTFSMTITLPDGVAPGQQLLVILVVEGGTETVDVSTTTGDDSTQLTAAGGWTIMQWSGNSTIGWLELAKSAT